MNTLFFTKPVQVPVSSHLSDQAMVQGVEALRHRAMELLHAAAWIDSAEPGLLTPEDRETARRRGYASAKRLLTECKTAGKPHICYYRAISGSGLIAAPHAVSMLADRIWILEDRYGLADAYLRGAADAALQKGVEVILCPSPLRRDKMEVVFLPAVRAAYLSERAADSVESSATHCVHLDRIPDRERRQALRGAVREDRRMIESLIERAAQMYAGAAILSDLGSDTCADSSKQL